MSFKLPPKTEKVTLIEIDYLRVCSEEQERFLNTWQEWLKTADKRITLISRIYNSVPPLRYMDENIQLVKRAEDEEFAGKNIAITIMIVLFGTGVTYIVAGKALKPVAGLSAEVAFK